MIIAIDGPAAAGKGTLARNLVDELGYVFLDTGMLYRAVAVLTEESGGNVEDQACSTAIARRLTPELIAEMQDAPRLRTPEAGQGASKVSVHSEVRAALLDFQRMFGRNKNIKGAILDGRDIGTVIFPDAEIKFFVTASSEVRASRRHLEFISKGIASNYDDILVEIKKRDERDMNRAAAPLRPAADAFMIDTSDMTEQEVFNVAMEYIRGRT